jgi:hypothetical protein
VLHVEQHDIAENIAELERIDVAPRGEFPVAPLALQIGEESVQPLVAQRSAARGSADAMISPLLSCIRRYIEAVA